MQTARTVIPGPSQREVEALDARAAELLDLQLDSIYGGEFSAVVEYHFRQATGAGLFQALKGDPGKASATLRLIFNSERAVGSVLGSLAAKLRESDPAPERDVLLSAISPLDAGAGDRTGDGPPDPPPPVVFWQLRPYPST